MFLDPQCTKDENLFKHFDRVYTNTYDDSIVFGQPYWTRTPVKSVIWKRRLKFFEGKMRGSITF